MIIGDNFKVFKAQCVNFLVRLMAQNGNLYQKDPPGGSHFSERPIGIVKNSLKKILGGTRLTYGEIHTQD